MSERWFSPARFGPTGGIITQALSILGVAAVAALVHASLTPESDVWVDPYAGFSQRPAARVDPAPALVAAETDGASDVDEGGSPSTDASAEPPASGPLEARITSEQAYALFESGEVNFLDARAKEDYEAGHILGAMNVPYESAAVRVAQLVGEGWISPTRRVVVYCIGGQCTESDFVVRALLQSGFDASMVHIDTGGYPAWESAGYPTETGTDVTEMP